jgi:hypothetical protein
MKDTNIFILCRILHRGIFFCEVKPARRGICFVFLFSFGLRSDFKSTYCMQTHACTHTCTCTCTHAHMHTCTHAYMHTCTHAHMHTCTHAHMHTCTHAHMHTCTHAHMHTCTHAHMHTYTCTAISAIALWMSVHESENLFLG